MSSNIIDYIRAGPKTDRQDINKILAELQDINAQDPEDAALQKRVALWDSRRKRTSSVEKSGAVDTSKSFTRDRRTEPITMQMPSVCESFPFIDTLNGAPTFPAGVENGGTKFGGRGTFDGSSDYITIANIVGSDLDIGETDVLTIAFFIKSDGTSGTNDEIIAKRDNRADEGYSVFWNSSDDLLFEVTGTSSDDDRVTADDTTTRDGNWHSVVCSRNGVDATGMKIYVDAVEGATNNSNGLVSSSVNTKAFSIGAESGGVNKVGASLAWVMVLKEEVDSAWVTNFDLGHFDFSGGNLVFFIPFVGDAEVFGEATTPYCVSS